MLIDIRASDGSENGFNYRGDAMVVSKPDIDRFGRVLGLAEGTAGAEGGGPDDDFGNRIFLAGNQTIDGGNYFILVLIPEFLSSGKIGLGEMGRFEEVDGGPKQGGRNIDGESGDVQTGGLVPETGNGEIW